MHFAIKCKTCLQAEGSQGVKVSQMDSACPRGRDQQGKKHLGKEQRHGAEYNIQCRLGSTATDANPDAPITNSVTTG